MAEELKLKVGELTGREDFGRGIARLDTNSMKKIGVKEGDLVEIEGKKKSGAVAIRSYPADVGLNILRMDGLVRKNCDASIGEFIKIRKTESKEAKKVTLAPAQRGYMLHISPNLLKQNLFMRPMSKGDIIITNPVFKSRNNNNDIFSQMLKDAGFNIDINLGEGVFFPMGAETRLVVVKTQPDGIVQITEMTELELLPEAVEVAATKLPEVTYEDIGGLSEIVPKIREMIEIPLRRPEVFERLGIDPPKGVLLYGAPGTGKTLIAKAVANEAGANFISVAGPEFMSKFYGESEENLRKIFDEADKNAPSIIFIDEIDAIAPKREQVVGEVERRVVSTLLTQMDGLKSRGKVIVIAATNVPNMLDPALRRTGRFDREIEIPIPDKKGRKEILQIHTRRMPLDKDVGLDNLAEITYGYVGADLSGVAKEAGMHALRRVIPDISSLKEDESIPKEVLERLKVTKEDFDYALRMVPPSAMREVLVEIPKIKWEDVGGLEEVKQALKEAVELPLKDPECFKRLGIRPPRGILLYGPPGCGKTYIVKALANESGTNFIAVKGPEILTMWVGESERKLREVFKRAKQVAPAIILFDEIDALAPKRGIEIGARVTEQIVSQLLTEMSGIEEMEGVVVIGTSVSGDTPILLKQSDGNIKLVHISEFVDQYYAEDEEGIEKPVYGVKCLGFDRREPKSKFSSGYRFGNSAFKNVRGVFRHKINEIYEIEFLGGKVRTTGNHSVFIKTKGGVEAKMVDQLKRNDILVDLPFKVKTTGNIRELRAHKFNENFNLELPIFERKLALEDLYNLSLEIDSSQHKMASLIGLSQSTISNWRRGINIPRELSKRYFKHDLQESVKVESDLMRLFGYYTAEGYARKEIDFCFNRNETNLIADTKGLMKKFFNLNPDRIRNVTHNATNIVYYSKPLAQFFTKHCGKGAHNKHLPSFIFEAPRDYFIEFLRGYIAGDGHITKEGKVSATSVSKQLILELNWLCRMHGVKSYVGKFIAKAGRKINGVVLEKDSIAYTLGIGKTSNPFINSNKICFSKRPIIKAVRKVPYNGYVYDLCGCDNEAFFGGETPVLLHNTNRPDIVDPALLRPGRFDRLIYVPAPDEKTRLEILKVHTRGMPLKNVSLEKLVKDTDGYSGADLEALSREAAMFALREDTKAKEITSKHFDKALKKIKPSIIEDSTAKYQKAVEDVKKNKIDEAARYIG